MCLVTANGLWCRVTCHSLSTKTHLGTTLPFSGYPFSPFASADILALELNLEGYGTRVVASASRKSAKKLKRNKEQQNEVILQTVKTLDGNNGVVRDPSSRSDGNKIKSEIGSVSTNVIPSRRDVLQACILTSGLIAALGFTIRLGLYIYARLLLVLLPFIYESRVSPVASGAGLPFFDCSQVSFSFEVWHLEVITGLVLLISISRYTLLQNWPDFSESSEAANTQVLTSLQTFDYPIVAFLPGITEELLFRGGLLPLFGLNWKSALTVAALFGVLHLGSGRKSSFGIWATFVGFAYGYATIVTSSVVVPMAAHALNNLIGAILWYQTSKSSKQISN